MKATARPPRAPLGLAMLTGLALSGCPAGAELDTPYQQYAPLPSNTTGNADTCNDSNVDDRALVYWCSSSSCHGLPGMNNASAPLWLFSPTRMTDFLDVPAVTEDCTAELVVDTNTPENSLIIRAMKHTSPCGLEMPDGIDVDPPELTCIEEWVHSMVATAAGVGAEPGVGGTSGF